VLERDAEGRLHFRSHVAEYPSRGHGVGAGRRGRIGPPPLPWVHPRTRFRWAMTARSAELKLRADDTRAALQPAARGGIGLWSINIDRASPVPPSRPLAEALLRAITEGSIGSGARLPSICFSDPTVQGQ
jgi:hypothetical protein